MQETQRRINLRHIACLTWSSVSQLLSCIDPWPISTLLLYVGFSAGVNSFVTRAIKKMMISTKEQGKDTTLFVVGEKGRSQLARVHANVSILTLPRASPKTYSSKKFIFEKRSVCNVCTYPLPGVHQSIAVDSCCPLTSSALAPLARAMRCVCLCYLWGSRR